ncbi:sulfite exporter TauE/SafE family protein [Agilicoccus flavus]|uniref:sulfite exporter TauE/SafE family protein n=1 Tax=Agilicoccus flavus TaxID=2775968 RepID=UPI001CF64553|nr:sulfite exporter TauE/SafE family protein [Agilicoccus flavus]
MIGVLVVVAVAAVVQLATGFGFALVSVPLLALVTDAHQAVLLALLLATVDNLGQAVEGRKVVDRSVIGRLLLGALVGLPLGCIAFTRSDARVLQLTIGAVILVTVVALARGATLARSSRRVDLLVGTLSGMLTTCTGTNGPPVVAVARAGRGGVCSGYASAVCCRRAPSA